MHHPLAKSLKTGVDIVQELAPLRERKNTVIAFAAGLVLGALGVALYLKSIKDFAICVAMFLGLSVLVPGVGTLPGWLFAPAYSAWRAYTSNQNMGW